MVNIPIKVNYAKVCFSIIILYHIPSYFQFHNYMISIIHRFCISLITYETKMNSPVLRSFLVIVAKCWDKVGVIPCVPYDALKERADCAANSIFAEKMKQTKAAIPNNTNSFHSL